jgi:hypothetical protein
MAQRIRAARSQQAGRQRPKAATAVARAPGRERQGEGRAHADLLHLQQSLGNARVARLIESRSIARAPATAPPAAKGEAEQAPPGPAEDPIQKLILEQLGAEKLKEHGKKLAGKSVDFLMSQVKEANSEADFVSKAQIGLIGTMLSDQAKADAEALLKSDAGKALRERLVTITKDEPAVIIAAAIAAAAIAYMANPDLPEIKKKVTIVKGLTAEGTLDLGKVQDLTVQKAGLALKYSRKQFSFSASAGWEEGEKKEGETGALSLRPRDTEFKSDMEVDPGGKAKVNLSQAIEVDKLKVESGVEIVKDDMAAIVAIKIGDKNQYVSGKTKVNSDGKVDLDLGFKSGDFEITGSGKGLGGDKPTGEVALESKNSFRVKGLDLKAKVKFGSAGVAAASGSAAYNFDTKGGKAYISFTGETVAGPEKGSAPIGVQGVLGVGFRFKGL